MHFFPEEDFEAGFTVFQTPEHHYDVVVSAENGIAYCFLRKVVGDIIWIGPKLLLSSNTLSIHMDADRVAYSFSVTAGQQVYPLGTGRTQLLSTEAMQYQNFTGTFLALFACSNGEKNGKAIFESFTYEV